MTTPSPASSGDEATVPAWLRERLERIETALAHLQHDIDGLNASLTTHLHRLQTVDERFTRLEHELQILSESGEVRDPADEKPPHY
ncbi:MAG: SlyX family protein [Planctomycetaceae bacterium]|nr:SlyX family protein [Planctomycetaceae bacterium]MCA9065536.1 SlyX family protein [Planctomycetaceae bacterium]